MAEEPLVKEVLTEHMIAAGAELTTELDRAKWPVVAALWLFDADNNEWRLLLASPSVRLAGPRAAYAQVASTLRNLRTPLPLESVTVVEPEDSRIRLLTSAYQSNRNLEGHRFFRGAIGGHVIDDAYIYRLLPVAPAA